MNQEAQTDQVLDEVHVAEYSNSWRLFSDGVPETECESVVVDAYLKLQEVGIPLSVISFSNSEGLISHKKRHEFFALSLGNVIFTEHQNNEDKRLQIEKKIKLSATSKEGLSAMIKLLGLPTKKISDKITRTVKK